MERNIPTYKITFNPDLEHPTGIDEIAYVADPAILKKGIYLNSQPVNIQLDSLKMQIIAPVLIPNIKIYRVDDELGEYYIEFTAEKIAELKDKFDAQLQDGRNKFNIDHTENKAPSYIKESWIVEDPQIDKISKYENLKDIPQYSWMMWSQFRDKEYFKNEIVAKGRTGFSIEGFLDLELQSIKERLKKQMLKNISFDYDGTLTNSKGKELAKQLILHGNEVFIITSRSNKNSDPVYKIADELGIPHSRVIFTDGKSKVDFIKSNNIDTHYDNNPNVINDINQQSDAKGIKLNNSPYENIYIKIIQQMANKYRFEIVGKLDDGTVVIFPGEFKVGSEVLLMDESGNRVVAEDDTYKLQDGTEFLVKDGKIESIIDPSQQSESTPAEEVISTESSTAVAAEAIVPQTIEVKIDSTTLEKLTSELIDKISKLETKLMTEIENKFNSNIPDSTIVSVNMEQKEKREKLSRREEVINTLGRFKETTGYHEN